MANTFSSLEVAADSHNVLAAGTSWLDPESWTNKLGNAGKFIATSLMSGANGFYNTAVAVGNFAGADLQERDTQQWISSADADWGRYYEANKSAVDTTGFILGSLVPGIGGAKIFNAGQAALRTAISTGKISGNLSRVTGLLVTNKAQYLDDAANVIKSSFGAVNTLNMNTYKALASGVYQNVLEAAAGEVFIAATLFKSPVLEDLTVSDMAKNALIGAGLGGAIGGSIDAARSFGFLRRTMDAVDKARLPWTQREMFAEATSPSSKAIQLMQGLEDVQLPRKPTANMSEAELKEVDIEARLYARRIDKDLTDVRAEINKLAGADLNIGNALADIAMPLRAADGGIAPGAGQRLFENLLGAVRVTHAGRTTSQEILYAKAKALGKTPEKEIAVRYVSILGDDVGKVFDENPLVRHLGDAYDSPEAAARAIRAEGFSLKEMWDAAEQLTSKSYLTAQKRYAWALNPKSLPEIPAGTVIHQNDFPLLTRAYMDGNLDIKIAVGKGPALELVTPGTKQELLQLISEGKFDVAQTLHMKGAYIAGKETNLNADQVAKIVDMRRSYLEGTHSANIEDDIFAHRGAMRSSKAVYNERGIAWEDTAHEYFLKPSVAKVVYEVDPAIAELDGNVLNAMVHFKQQQQLHVENARRVTAKHLGTVTEQMPDFNEATLARINRRGAGATTFAGANSQYGSPGQIATQLGKVTSEIERKFAGAVEDKLNVAYAPLLRNQAAAIEFNSISQRLARTPDLFKLTELNDGTFALVESKALKALEKSGNLTLDDLTPEQFIRFQTKEAQDAWVARIGVADEHTSRMRDVHAARGHSHVRELGVARPVRPDPRDYPYYAFVYDPRITNSGHVAMIHAATEREFVALVDRVPEHFRVASGQEMLTKIKTRTRLELDEGFKARGEFDYDRTLHENYINSELASKGVYSDYFPKTDPAVIVNQALQEQARQARGAAKELVRLHYDPEFSMLQDMGDEYAKYSTSKFGASIERLQRTSDNPYYNYVRTALNVSNLNENNFLHGINKWVDSAGSRAYAAIVQAGRKVRTPAELDVLNAELDKYGMKPAYYDAALEMYANHTAPRGVVTQFVRRANSMLSMFTLGLDPLNALNNAIGANVLRQTELASLTRSIKQGNAELAGEFAALAKIKLPESELAVLSPSKLLGRALANLATDGANGPLKAKYRSWGLIRDRQEQLALLAEDFTLRGTETVAELNAREASAFARFKEMSASLGDSAEKITLNPFVEEANRFLSANVAEQITDLAQKYGLMDSRTAQAYINTFVNRVEGSIIASQRPLVFQGPIGQAVGLFQRYQFNLLQQMFRYVSEGSRKDAAMMLGLQSTLYGMQSLPAFQAINTHIIGTASGNTENRDFYTQTYGAVGSTAGDFLLYGVPSALLNMNIYNRGDINPRHMTILPTTIQDIPLVAGWGKFIGNMMETIGKLGAGGNFVETLLQGIEHNGISRPLAGIAQVAQAFGPGGQVYSTSNKGSILYQNDLVSFASLVRIAGGRPLDEARLNDEMWRVQVYQAARNSKVAALGELVKTSIINGEVPDAAQMEAFAEKYAKLGGSQKDFNRHVMRWFKDANVPQAEQLAANLRSPHAQHLQLLLGGDQPD